MIDLLIFLAKGSLLLTILYAVDVIWLRSDTHFHFRRLYLLGILILSLLLPLISMEELPLWRPNTAWEVSMILPLEGAMINTADLGMEEIEQGWTWVEVGSLIFMLGLFVMLGRLGLIVFQLRGILSGGRSVARQEHVLVYSKSVQVPFSLFRYIVLPEHDKALNPAILNHEAAHIRYRHSVDILLAEFFLLMFWFHPLAWLLKRSLLEVHEYQVDNHMLLAGFDRKQYQRLLLHFSTGGQRLAIANSFNQLITKKRIFMMNKQRSSKTTLLKYGLVIPALFLSMSLIALGTGPDLRSGQETLMGEPYQGFVIKGKILKKADQSPVIGATILIQDTKIGSITDKNGEFWIKIPDSPATLQFAYVDMDSYSVQVDQTGELVILLASDGSDSKHKFISKPDLPPPPPPDLSVDQLVKIRPSNDKQPLYVIDGKVQSRDAKPSEMNPDDIESINVLKGEKAFDKYGKKAKNGVVEITTKKKH